jgi:hypothetical protein
LPQHPDIDFGSWAPVRSKAFVQAFADFLVACKKAEKGWPQLWLTRKKTTR